MIGDKLASGAPSATFPGPKLHFDQAEMQRDLRELPAAAFMEKYYVAQREYEFMLQCDGEEVASLTRSISERIEAIERITRLEHGEDRSLERECFIEPFVPGERCGKIIVSRDQPTLRKEQSKLALPRHLRKERERLPTTGHVIRARLFSNGSLDTQASNEFIGLRVLFGPMSGTAICFKGYPTWIALDLAEVIGIIHKDDAEIIEEDLEPLV